MMDARLSAAIGKRRGVPELYVLDKNGRVIQKYFGQMVDVDFFDLVRYSKSTDTPNPTPKLSRWSQLKEWPLGSQFNLYSLII